MSKIILLTVILASSAIAETGKPLTVFEQFVENASDINMQAKSNTDNINGITIVTVGTDVSCDYQNHRHDH